MGEVFSTQSKEEDVVIGTNDLNVIRAAQENHGGWHSDMNECMKGPCRVLMKNATDAVVCAPSRRIFQINLQLLKPYESDQFQKGDIVKISDDINLSERLQVMHGGWLPVMALLAGETGKVNSILPTGDIIVKVNGIKLAYNPQLLNKIESRNTETNKASTIQKIKFSSDDTVRIIEDKNRVMQLQKNHGGWNELMSPYLGMECTIMSSGLDGDLQVSVMGNIITLNPECVEKIDRSVDSEFDPTLLSTLLFAKFLEVMSGVNTKSDGIVRMDKTFELFLAVREGDLRKVNQLMDHMGPEVSFNSLTPLMVAVAEGHTEIVKYLLQKKVNVNAMDKDGDTALHFAAQKNKLNMCKILVENGADINIQNNKKMTPIMTSVLAGSQDVLQMFISRKDAKVNIQDTDGDTALHLAILQSRSEIAEILINRGADMKVFNKKNLSPFHLAAFQGNDKILETLLKRCNGSMVDLQNDDEFAAIHIAALKNHLKCLKILIQYKVNVNIQNNKLQTALHLAISEKYFDFVKILVENKADLNMKDIEGDTPLHDSIRMLSGSNPRNFLELFMTVTTGSDEPEEIAAYLIENGANLDVKNLSGRTPMDLCRDESIKNKFLTIKLKYEEKKTEKKRCKDCDGEIVGGKCRICDNNLCRALKTEIEGTFEKNKLRISIRKMIPRNNSWNCTSCTFANPSSAQFCEVCEKIRESLDEGRDLELPEEIWICNSCTFLNPLSSKMCEICMTINEGIDVGRDLEVPEETWICRQCKTSNSFERYKCSNCNASAEFLNKWVCERCRFFNEKLANKCGVCENENPNIVKCSQCKEKLVYRNGKCMECLIQSKGTRIPPVEYQQKEDNLKIKRRELSNDQNKIKSKVEKDSDLSNCRMITVFQDNEEVQMWMCGFCKKYTVTTIHKCTHCKNLRDGMNTKKCLCGWNNLPFRNKCENCNRIIKN